MKNEIINYIKELSLDSWEYKSSFLGDYTFTYKKNGSYIKISGEKYKKPKGILDRIFNECNHSILISYGNTSKVKEFEVDLGNFYITENSNQHVFFREYLNALIDVERTKEYIEVNEAKKKLVNNLNL
jgi:hypothetical protein